MLEIADKILMMPDLLGYMLCGVKTTEYTNATTYTDAGGRWELVKRADPDGRGV